MGCWVISGWFVHRRSVGVAGAVGTVDVVDVVVHRSSAASPVQPAACAAGLNQTASIPPESPAFQSICPRHNIKIHSDCPRNQMLPQHRNASIILRPQTIFKRGNMYACSSAARSLTRCIPILPRRPVFSSATLHTSTSSGFASLTHQRAFRRNACAPCIGDAVMPAAWPLARAIPCVLISSGADLFGEYPSLDASAGW